MTDAQLDYTVELDVSGGDFGSAFDGTDVSDHHAAGFGFNPVTVTWGRQDQFSDVTPTTVEGSLLNSDGRFSPGNSATIVSRTNLVLNPSFEVDATNYSVFGSSGSPTLTRVTTDHVFGTACGHFSWTGITGTVGISRTVTLTSGLPYTLSLYLKVDGASPLTVQLAAASPIVAQSVTVPADGAWHRYSFTFTAAGQSGYRPIQATTSGSTTGALFIDGIMLEQAATVGDYFDGSFTADDGWVYAWTGTANASTSTASLSYYPQIRRNLRRRVSVGVNSTTVNVSEDYATSLEVVPSQSNIAVTDVSGSDILARFGAATSTQDPSAMSIGTTLRSFIAEEVVLDGPGCLYMMQEQSGAASFGDLTGNCSVGTVASTLTTAGSVTAGQSAGGTWFGGTLVDIENSEYGSWTTGDTDGTWISFPTPDLSGGQEWTLEAWVQAGTAPPGANGAVIAAARGSGGTGFTYGFMLAADGTVEFHYAGSVIASSVSILDGKPHHIVGRSSFGGGFTDLLVDGVDVAAVATLGIPGPHTPITCGMFQLQRGSVQYPFSGSIAYLATYDFYLSFDRIVAHYQAGSAAFSGVDTTDQRITRLLSYRPGPGTVLDTGLSTMGAQDITGRTLQDCLFETGQVEDGVVFVDGLGQINFRSRSRLFNPTPTVTFDMSVGGVEFGSNWREDTQNVLNDVTITNNTTGSAQRFFDADSITADGEYSTSLSLPVYLDADALNLAGWMVANGTQPQLTATPLIVNLLHITPAQAQAVLQLAPLDCIELTNCPTPAPSSTMTFIVQGGTTSLASDAASVTLNLTPLPYPVGVWDTTDWDAAGVTWAP